MNNEEKERHTFDGMEPVVKSVSVKKPQSFFGERSLTAIEMAPRVLRYQSRRDFLVFGAGALAALAGAGFVLPQQTLSRMGMPRNMDSPGKEWFLNKALRIDDDVAEALYSGTRRVPTYTKSQITSLKNNYNGATPDPSYITGWNLTLSGLASGLSISLDIRNLLTRFSVHEQITRLVCVEGWSGIAWWAGLKFDDLLRAYPRCRKRNGRVWSLRSISMPRGILTLTLCRSTWRRPAIDRHCSPHTSTASPLRWIMEHRSDCWCP